MLTDTWLDTSCRIAAKKAKSSVQNCHEHGWSLDKCKNGVGGVEHVAAMAVGVVDSRFT